MNPVGDDKQSAVAAEKDETLLTEKSLQLSLSPPRCPPYGTAHRSVLNWSDPSNVPYVDSDPENQAHSAYNLHSGAKERIMHLVYNSRLLKLPHPHLPIGPELADAVTRFLGSVLPLPWINHVRDSGKFQSLMDGVVTASIPLGALTKPTAAAEFLRLTRQLHVIRYGEHESQHIDMIFPQNVRQEELKGLVFFVHGGAWGSGKPWFYRLVASPFLEMGLAVAIVGYRVYPAGHVNAQVHDLNLAYNKLAKEYPDLCGQSRIKRPLGLIVMGHSSGAHIALLLIVEQVKRLIFIEESKLQMNSKLFVDRFIGLSGIYDISHHFDYEAARGVEELSPMKAANGFSREQFQYNSPALRLRDFLAKCNNICPDIYFPLMLLVHGIEDDTVPFTATSEGARVLRSCGISKCEEAYVPKLGHQDCVVDFMLGGRPRKVVLDWLENRGTKTISSRL